MLNLKTFAPLAPQYWGEQELKVSLSRIPLRLTAMRGRLPGGI
jgi:hypothetical protein